MPCHAAVVKKTLIVSEDETVEKTLKALKKSKGEAALLVDGDGQFSGLFTLASLFENILPVQVNMTGGDDVTLGAAPGIAKRLLKANALPVSHFKHLKAQSVLPQTPLWEGIKMLSDNQNLPVVVLDEQTSKPLGYMTQSSVLEELERMQGE
ncbi:MAG: hypothetical protein CL570_01940 [Alphaproteobacteria bacterium]|nr:hypothetical protein [Alphaproteobacteria bacterium]HCQ71100.1 hypothetical protein [Rhodospirillaceae bacterium]|tara:strand:- start:49130 stop:49585 length:456 start_codon:yes stop_codon:yes gene_type:complete